MIFTAEEVRTKTWKDKIRILCKTNFEEVIDCDPDFKQRKFIMLCDNLNDLLYKISFTEVNKDLEVNKFIYDNNLVKVDTIKEYVLKCVIGVIDD